MSARAIRAIRGERDLIPKVAEEGSDESEDEETHEGGGASAFAAMMDSDDEEESESEEENGVPSEESSKRDLGKDIPERKAPPTIEPKPAPEPEAEEEEDLDELLNEFKKQDVQVSVMGDAEDTGGLSELRVILQGMDVQDLDIDYSMRNSLLAGSGLTPQQSRPKKNRQAFLFGSARDGWVKPPKYVGGGIGMTTYDQDPRPLPWPYNDSMVENENNITVWTDEKRWFAFTHSDSYQRDLEDYRRIQASGDFNALVLFVTHHPFVTDALLQLATVLYQTNHSQEGLALLRRCLWIYESSSLLSFARQLDGGSFMDADRSENLTYFQALWKLVKVSNIASLPRTALAVSRFILSLDPLRDPKRVLLALDYYALASNDTAYDQWLVHLVESDIVQIWYREDDTSSESYSCGLLDMPNWAFSYALALFRLQSDSPSEELKSKANYALQKALSRYPAVIAMLLQASEVDTTGRSFVRDWVKVLDFATDRSRRLRHEWLSSDEFDTIIVTASLQVCELIIKIFVQQNAKFWGDDDVLLWVYSNLEELQSINPDLPRPPEYAISRYADSIISDYDTHIERLPEDANIIDPGLIAHAMFVDPNRPRLLRRMQQRGGFVDDPDANANAIPMARQQLLGAPMNAVDPDWPLVEVFWRSFLPWNHVEGVPPPQR